MISYHRRLALWTCVSALAFMVFQGCGNKYIPTYHAGGKVVFADGEPLKAGKIEFKPINSIHSVVAKGNIQSDGTFELSTFIPEDGAIEGEHGVLIVPPVPDSQPGRPPTFVPIVIDPRYTRYETSGLTCTVARDSGKNRFTIQVQRPRQ